MDLVVAETNLARSPVIIAAEINSIKRQTKTLILQASVEIGRRLQEAKSLVKHGEWGDWLETNVEYSQSTANNLMRIADEYGGFANSQALGNLSYTQAVALLGMPAVDREEFAEEHDLDTMTTRQLQQAVKERDEAHKRAEAAQGELRAARRLAEEAAHSAELRLETIEKDRRAAKEREAKLLADLEEARKSDKQGATEYERLAEELEQVREQLNQLQESSQQPVTLEPAVVERVPAAVEQELAELRARALQPPPEALTRYRVQFEALTVQFSGLLATLESIRPVDSDTYARYRRATLNLLDKMQDRLSGSTDSTQTAN